MPAPELISAHDAEAASRRAAELLAGAVAAACAQRGAAHLALSGGGTPRRSYELLGASEIDWPQVHIWFCDERCVPADDEQSNLRLVRETLGDVPAQWHPVRGELGPDAAAHAYERELGDVVLDVALLGIGPDGHTASLFPDHPALDATGRAVGVSDAPKPPPERVSLTLPTLGAARGLVLLVTEREKAPALAAALGEPSRSTPASLLARDRLTVVASREAL
jgi:6-phosphogluconolactonase